VGWEGGRPRSAGRPVARVAVSFTISLNTRGCPIAHARRGYPIASGHRGCPIASARRRCPIANARHGCPIANVGPW
jgi:hypothetical protein